MEGGEARRAAISDSHHKLVVNGAEAGEIEKEPAMLQVESCFTTSNAARAGVAGAGDFRQLLVLAHQSGVGNTTHLTPPFLSRQSPRARHKGAMATERGVCSPRCCTALAVVNAAASSWRRALSTLVSRRTRSRWVRAQLHGNGWAGHLPGTRSYLCWRCFLGPKWPSSAPKRNQRPSSARCRRNRAAHGIEEQYKRNVQRPQGRP